MALVSIKPIRAAGALRRWALTRRIPAGLDDEDNGVDPTRPGRFGGGGVSAAEVEQVRGVALTAARSGGRRAAARSDGPTTQTPNTRELEDELGDAAWLYEWAHEALRPSRDVVSRIT